MIVIARPSFCLGYLSIEDQPLGAAPRWTFERAADAELPAADEQKKRRTGLSHNRMEDDQRRILVTVFASPFLRLLHSPPSESTGGLKRLGTTRAHNRRVSRAHLPIHLTC